MKLLATTNTEYHLQDDDGQEHRWARVTSCLSLLQDFSHVPPDVLAHAAERGKAVHRACWLLCGGADGSGLDRSTLHPEVAPYVAAFEAAQRTLRFAVVEKEVLVYSTRFRYAGRVDLVVKGIGPRTSILDLKTAAQESPVYALQVSAYLEAWKELTTSRAAIDRHILYLKSNGSYRLVSLPAASHAGDFRTFLACQQVYLWKQANSGNGKGR